MKSSPTKKSLIKRRCTNGLALPKVLLQRHTASPTAEVKVKLAEDLEEFPIVALIDAVEGALKTPVQAAVKREDEQEFARLNGQNLMFCEDARADSSIS